MIETFLSTFHSQLSNIFKQYSQTGYPVSVSYSVLHRLHILTVRLDTIIYGKPKIKVLILLKRKITIEIL